MQAKCFDFGFFPPEIIGKKGYILLFCDNGRMLKYNHRPEFPYIKKVHIFYTKGKMHTPNFFPAWPCAVHEKSSLYFHQVIFVAPYKTMVRLFIDAQVLNSVWIKRACLHFSKALVPAWQSFFLQPSFLGLSIWSF